MSASTDPRLRSVVGRWMEKAKHDMLVAENTLKTMGDDCPYDTVCFHAQQAVEKYVKAVLVCERIDFIKTHDAGELVDLLPKGKRPELSQEELEALSDYAVAVRYPGVREDLTRHEAQNALRVAERVEKWALGRIPTETGG